MVQTLKELVFNLSGPAVVAYFALKLVQHRRSYRHLPKPPHHILWGHLKVFGEVWTPFPNNLHIQAANTILTQKYKLPGLGYLDLGPLGPCQLLITDPELTLIFNCYEESPQIIGAGNIATSGGAAWKAAHNMLALAFSPSHVRGMVGPLAEEVMVFRSVLQKHAVSGEKFSLESELRNLVYDFAGAAVFQTPLDTQKRESTLLRHFTDACNANFTVQSSRNPIKLLSAIGKRRAAASLSKKRGLCITDLIIREHVDKVGKNGVPALDAHFMTMATTHVKTLLLAGYSTTTSTLYFTYMLLSIYPDIVQRLREEHDTQPQKLNELEFTTNVIKEVLRFYPYPTRGQMTDPVQLAMHMHPALFPNPTVFDPDRFSRDDSPPNAWRAFERGPRACLGQTLAMNVMKITPLFTIQDFDFACADLEPTKQRVSWTNLDVIFGDRAFQEQVFEPKSRDGMPIIVRRFD
ncbi:cytochrome P450 [Lentithecium fluviatile CBS 122367]|uniref:Cytochrome P450 n=1 Tax=Lentithecium fluviatile CBS 122367 TaxID=1168545 RepID=A0A6G1IWJ3_9PLEO|nr:cytochrome P450 [Lentithecium fluviatile CBS 122367]